MSEMNDISQAALVNKDAVEDVIYLVPSSSKAFLMLCRTRTPKSSHKSRPVYGMGNFFEYQIVSLK